MKYPAKFDKIRCYYDEEVNAVIPGMVNDPFVQGIVAQTLGGDNASYFLRSLEPINSVADFQKKILATLMAAIEHKTCTDVELIGTENLDQSKGRVYISNHRDIVMDSAFLNIHLFFKNLKTTQIGIGNNLLLYPAIEHTVRINKCFVVRRDGGVKQQLLISKELSEYIRFSIVERADSVWLAQREGRSKDSKDLTQPSVLKMLRMSGERSFYKAMQELNITPLSINYEYDSTDYLKAKEFQQKRDNPDFVKSEKDDLINMKVGVMGHKGRVSLVISDPIVISEEIDALPRNQQAEALGKQIDKQIHKNYKLFPTNYIAADLMEGSNRFEANYTAKEKASFLRYLHGQLGKIDLPHKDENYLLMKMFAMYGNPALNKSNVE